MSADFRHRVRVRYGECDSQGVLFNAHYLAFADLTLTELWRSALPGGYAAMVASGTDMVAAEAHVRFLAPTPFDEALAIELAVTRLGSTGMSSSFWMARGEQTLAEVHLRHVFVTAAGGAKTPIPDAVRTGLAPYRAHAMVAGNAG